MHTYRVFYSNVTAALFNAYTPGDAQRMAEEQAARDGYPGLSVESVEELS